MMNASLVEGEMSAGWWVDAGLKNWSCTDYYFSDGTLDSRVRPGGGQKSMHGSRLFRRLKRQREVRYLTQVIPHSSPGG